MGSQLLAALLMGGCEGNNNATGRETAGRPAAWPVMDAIDGLLARLAEWMEALR
ncbi:hypothetical protein D3C87_690850 [compost metagenome]